MGRHKSVAGPGLGSELQKWAVLKLSAHLLECSKVIRKSISPLGGYYKGGKCSAVRSWGIHKHLPPRFFCMYVWQFRLSGHRDVAMQPHQSPFPDALTLPAGELA